jgi:hypothetical protein
MSSIKEFFNTVIFSIKEPLNNLATLILASPKTYIPLVIAGVIWILDGLLTPLGIKIEFDEGFKNAATIICLLVAMALIRRGMVKEGDMQGKIDELQSNLDSAVTEIIKTRTTQLNSAVKTIIAANPVSKKVK